MRELLMVFQGAFYRGWGGPIPRMLAIVEGLQAHGWRTTILAQDLGSEMTPGGPQGSFPGRVVLAKPRELWLNWWGLRRLWQRTFDRRRYADPEEAWGARVPDWYRASGSYIPADVVWGISVGGVRDAVAARNLAAHCGCPWVLEFRDPCPYPGVTLSAEASRSLARCLDSCAAVVTTTQALADQLAEAHPVCAGNTHAVYTGYDDRVAPAAPSATEGPLTLLHAGKLHGGDGRSALPLVRALAAAFEQEPRARGEIELHLLGGDDGGAEAEALAGELGISEAVLALPQIPMAAAQDAMDAADALVLIKFPDPAYNLQIPGKAFHYLGRGKPILGIMGDCEAAEIITRSGLGTVKNHDDVPGLARYILDAWTGRAELAQRIVPNWEYIRRFSRTRMAEQVACLLGDVLSSQRGQ